jgi:hypothetical protein
VQLTNRRFSRIAAVAAVCLLIVFALAPRPSWAQAPSGNFTFSFDAATTPLIDLSGQFDISQNIVGSGGTLTPLILHSLTLTNDPNGKLHGSGVVIVEIGNDVVAAAYTARGNVTGGGLHPTRVALTVRVSGNDTIANNQNTPFTMSLRYNLFLDVENGTLQGSARGSVNLGPLGTGTVRDDSNVVNLPGGIDGSWSANLTVIPLNKLSGTGFISLPNGRNLQGLISGSFSANTGISKIKLTGTGSDKGFSVTFTTTASEQGLQLETVRGRILGQSVFE